METLVATAMVVIIFMVASLILNNLFVGTIKNSSRHIEAHLYQLDYELSHDKILLPYSSEFKGWDVRIDKFKEGGITYVEFEASLKNTQKKVTRQRPYEEN